MLMDNAMGFKREQDNFILFPGMADPIYDGAAFTLEDIMKSASLMKLFAGAAAASDLLHVKHL